MHETQTIETVVRKTIAHFMLNYMVRRSVDAMAQFDIVEPVVKTQTVFNELNNAVYEMEV